MSDITVTVSAPGATKAAQDVLALAAAAKKAAEEEKRLAEQNRKSGLERQGQIRQEQQHRQQYRSSLQERARLQRQAHAEQARMARESYAELYKQEEKSRQTFRQRGGGAGGNTQSPMLRGAARVGSILRIPGAEALASGASVLGVAAAGAAAALGVMVAAIVSVERRAMDVGTKAAAMMNGADAARRGSDDAAGARAGSSTGKDLAAIMALGGVGSAKAAAMSPKAVSRLADLLRRNPALRDAGRIGSAIDASDSLAGSTGLGDSGDFIESALRNPMMSRLGKNINLDPTAMARLASRSGVRMDANGIMLAQDNVRNTALMESRGLADQTEGVANAQAMGQGAVRGLRRGLDAQTNPGGFAVSEHARAMIEHVRALHLEAESANKFLEALRILRGAIGFDGSLSDQATAEGARVGQARERAERK